MNDAMPPMHSTPTSDATFAADVLASPVPVLVDFWAPWCGPCRVLGPTVDEVNAEAGEKYKVFKLNVDENPATTQEYGVMSIPTVIIFSGGKPVETSVGVREKADLQAMLAKYSVALN